MASAEGGSVPSGVEYGEGCPLSSRLRCLGERRELPQRKRIFAYFEGHNAYFCTYMIKSGGQFALASPAPNSRGGLVPLSPPRDLRPCQQCPLTW